MPGENSWEKFLENEELRIQWATENCAALGINKTPEEIKQLVNDPKKIDLYIRARKIIDREEECDRLEKKYKSKGYGENTDPSLARVCKFMFDTSGTKEADEKNIEFLKKIETPEGAMEVVNQYVNDCYNFDMTKLYAENEEEAIKLYEEHFEEIQKMFVIDSMSTSGTPNKNPALAQFNLSCIGLMEQITDVRVKVSKCASNNSLTIPDDYFQGPNAETHSLTGQPILNGLSVERTKRKDPGTAPTAFGEDKYHQLYFSYQINEHCDEGYKAFKTNFNKLKNQGIITKDFIKEYKCYDKNGQLCSLGVAIKSDKMDTDYTFVKYTEEEKEYIKENCKNAVVTGDIVAKEENKNILTILNYIEDEKVNKAKGTRSTNRINATKSVLNQLFGDKDTPREIPIISSPSVRTLAFSIVKGFKEKHESRSGWWKFFHPFQNYAEKNAVNELMDSLNKKMNVSKVTFDDYYNKAEVFKINEEGKYYFEEGKEPVQEFTEKALASKQKNQPKIDSNEDLHKALDGTTNTEPNKEDVKLTEKKEAIVEVVEEIKPLGKTD